MAKHADKLPSLQLYPGDWLKDSALRLCSPAARGIWVDILLLMFDCPQRGVYRVQNRAENGAVLRAVSHRNILKTVPGAKPKHLAELIANGVARVARKDGALYSKRLIRDELRRRHKAQAGSKGGQAKPKQNPSKRQAKRGSSVSSSTSASTSVVTTPIPPSLDTPEFKAAWDDWAAYRKEQRKALAESTIKRQLAKLAKTPGDAVAMIERSIEQGWTGLWPVDERPKRPSRFTPAETSVDYSNVGTQH